MVEILYRTHKAGGAFAMLCVFKMMQTRGWLLPDVNYVVQLMIMYPAASWGSMMPDLDHHWGSVKEQNPFNMLVHKVLHLSKPKHRSWQTHSLLVTGGLCCLVMALILLGNSLVADSSTFEWVFVTLVVIGGVVGVASHLILDAFTPSGIHIIPGMKFRFVPKHSFFATGGKWENAIFCLLMAGSFILFVNTVLGIYGKNFI